MKIAVAISGIIGLLIAVSVLLVYSGAYNVAASDPHSEVAARVLSTIQVRSVRARANTIEVPPLTDASMIRVGLHHYQEMCVTCHGAPGIDPSEIGKGLNPAPPDLSKSVKKYSEAELYWIIKHGIKMTGMPAFGETHTEEELWGMVAFLQRLPQLRPHDFRTMVDAAGGKTEGHSHGHSGGAAEGAEDTAPSPGTEAAAGDAGREDGHDTQHDHSKHPHQH